MDLSIRRVLLFCGFAAVTMTPPSFADADSFLTVDPPGAPTRGDVTLQQWFAWSTGRTAGSYSSFHSVTEVDYGLTDRLELALNLEYDWHRTRAPFQPPETESRPALSAEVLYVVLPPEPDRFGLAFAVDPAISRDDRGVAFRVLIQRNLFGFQNVLNINLETVWERTPSDHWSESSGIGIAYGIAYALTPSWAVALELNNDRSFDGLLLSHGMRQGSNSYFAGPTIQYDCERMVVTFGAQAQLPLASGPGTVHGFTPDVERFRLALRLATEI